MVAQADTELEQIEDRRQRILDAATGVVLDRGISGARLRDVSQRAKVSIGLIQHYFGSREELFSEAVKHASQRLLNSFAVNESEIIDPWDRILALIDRWVNVDDLVGHSAIWLHFADAARRSEARKAIFEPIYWRWFRYVQRAVQDGVAAGTMSPVMDVDDAVAVFMAFFDGYEVELATRIVEASPERIQRRAEALSRALFRPTA